MRNQTFPCNRWVWLTSHRGLCDLCGWSIIPPFCDPLSITADPKSPVWDPFWRLALCLRDALGAQALRFAFADALQFCADPAGRSVSGELLDKAPGRHQGGAVRKVVPERARVAGTNGTGRCSCTIGDGLRGHHIESSYSDI